LPDKQKKRFANFGFYEIIRAMVWLNYQHLFYFWTVVRKGSIVEACRVLRLAPSTVSAQIHALESSLGKKLLTKSGRNLRPTEAGTVVLGYADNIFSLGNELLQKVQGDLASGPRQIHVGIVDAVPKAVAHWLMEPALHLPEKVRVICRESSAERLLPQLMTGDLDVVLSDAPAAPNASMRAFSHLIVESGMSFVATAKLAAVYKRNFPDSFHGAPFLLPSENTSVRQDLDLWFESRGIQPDVVGEFEDHAMLRAFADSGAGIVPVASCVEQHFLGDRRLKKIGQTDSVRASYYAISTEKKLQSAPVAAICHRREVTSMLELPGAFSPNDA
jgi:LysR family transcriptional regulator, transcriptional activator of nhaA